MIETIVKENVSIVEGSGKTWRKMSINLNKQYKNKMEINKHVNKNIKEKPGQYTLRKTWEI